MRTPISEQSPSSSSSYATRWDALLTENSALHKEHLELLASFTSPFSAQQEKQLEASAARFASLTPKIRQLVEDWAKSLSPSGLGSQAPSLAEAAIRSPNTNK